MGHGMRRHFLVWTVLGWQAAVAAPLRTVQLQIAGHSLMAEVASAPDELSRGLSGRAGLAADHGMVFILPDQALRCVWMKGTLIPLTAAFVSPHGRIAAFARNMAPMTLDFHCGPRTARYVIEVNPGWFSRHGIAPGTPVQGLP